MTLPAFYHRDDRRMTHFSEFYIRLIAVFLTSKKAAGPDIPVPAALCTDGIDQLLFLFSGADHLFHFGDDGVGVGLRDAPLQLDGIRGLMDHDIDPVYRFLHRSTPLFRRVCVSLVLFALFFSNCGSLLMPASGIVQRSGSRSLCIEGRD